MVDERIYAQQSAADHHEIGEKFEELEKLDVRAEEWPKKFAELKKTYLDHLKEEEETIFGKAREALGEEPARPRGFEALERLAQRFEVLKPDAEAVKRYIAAHAS